VADKQKYFKVNSFDKGNRSALLRQQPRVSTSCCVELVTSESLQSHFFDCS